MEEADAAGGVLNCGDVLMTLFVPAPLGEGMVGKGRAVVMAKEEPFALEDGVEGEIGGDGFPGAGKFAVAGPTAGEPLEVSDVIAWSWSLTLDCDGYRKQQDQAQLESMWTEIAFHVYPK